MVVNATCGKQFNDIDIQNEVKDFFTSLKKMLKQIIQNSITKKEITNIQNIDKCVNYLFSIMQSVCVGLKFLPENQLHDYVEISFSVFERNK